ncbi:hypothetical protein PVAP13_9KG404608 [Panicum virgatum]|uniref:Uncharacterized protein n=1 Tax=Panicum virgatum TaxID=38727 RepID=A0A8T0N9X5_PANVG|nr:hypothetical protein PVAP13_9KG404608 [Panicum virgatum]
MRRRWLSADGVLALLHPFLVDSVQELVWERSRTKVVQPPAGMERQMGDLILCNRMCFLSFCSD